MRWNSLCSSVLWPWYRHPWIQYRLLLFDCFGIKSLVGTVCFFVVVMIMGIDGVVSSSIWYDELMVLSSLSDYEHVSLCWRRGGGSVQAMVEWTCGLLYWRRLHWDGDLLLSCRTISITIASSSCRELHSDWGGIVMPSAHSTVLMESDSVVSMRVWPLHTRAYHYPFVR